MNFFSPELLVLSARFAVLAVILSVLAFVIGRLSARRRAAPAPIPVEPRPLIQESSPVADELLQAKALAEELSRNLAATESQCVNALEQRDEAERQAVQKTAEARRFKEELAELQALETVPLATHTSVLQQLALSSRNIAANTPQDPVAVTARASHFLDANHPFIADLYRKDNGTVLDADAAKEYFPEYAYPRSHKTKYASAVYPPAQKLIDDLFATMVNEGEGITIFVSGGPGAGKSTVLKALLARLPMPPCLVMDGTLSNFERAKKNIDTAVAAGKQVVVAHVPRDFEASVHGVIDRAVDPDHGRAVPLEVTARKHFEARTAFIKLLVEYQGNGMVKFDANQFVVRDQLPVSMAPGRVGHDLPASVDIWIERAYQILHERAEHDRRNGKSFPEATFQALDHRPGIPGNVAGGSQDHGAEAADGAEVDAGEHAGQRALADAEAVAEQLQKDLAEARTALDTTEAERARVAQEQQDSIQMVGRIRETLDSTVAEVAALKQQVVAAEDLAHRRQDQLDLLASEKAEAELALKARIAELEAQATAIASAPPASLAPAKPLRLPRPPLPPPEVLAAPVDEALDHFPPAPEATPRKPRGDSLFEEAAIASFSPEIPSLGDAQETLAGLEQELQEKEQFVQMLTAEHARRQEDLDSVRHSPPEEQHGKLHAVEKEAHATALRLQAARADSERGRRQVRALTRSLQLAAAHTTQADDLTRIKGIKGGISQQLHAFGIFTYRQIVEWDAEDMQAFSELLAFKNRLHRDKWQEQARTLMEVKYGKGK